MCIWAVQSHTPIHVYRSEAILGVHQICWLLYLRSDETSGLWATNVKPRSSEAGVPSTYGNYQICHLTPCPSTSSLCSDASSFTSERLRNLAPNFPFSKEELHSEVRCLYNKAALCPDGIPVEVLKLIVEVNLIIILYTYNAW